MRPTNLQIAIAGLMAVAVSPNLMAGTIEFAEAPVPRTDAEKRAILTSEFAIVDGQQVPVEFNVLLRSGDQVAGGGIFGQLMDVNGMPLMAEDGSSYISNDNDFSSLIRGEDGRLYNVSHFEARPGAMYLTELNQDRTNGQLTPVRTRPLDFSHLAGGWVHCAGSVTPWGTHLGSEEYEPDAKQWRDGKISDYNAAMARYFNAPPEAAGSVMNPYEYGYPVEIKVDSFDSATVEKHYAMGRLALELAYVMPDNRTAYLTDDGTNVGLFRFVASASGDLSAGTLWAAQWNQVSEWGAGSGKLNWINLGYATAEMVEGWITNNTRFEDIFDEAEPVLQDGADTGECPEGFTSINAGHEDGDHQCLRLKDIDGDGEVSWTDELIASRLETRRWAAMEGATTEFRKMEGITYDPVRNKLYLAVSEVDRGMLDFGRVGRTGVYEKYDIGGPNHMQLRQGNVCGAVYAMDVDGSYTPWNIWSLVEGRPMTADYGAVADSPAYDGFNKCDVDGIANPDNITMMPGYDTLIIGEDTGSGHQNDMIWAMNLESGQLTRIQTTPYGSETTSPYFYPNIGGFAYLMSVVQHPYGESDEDKLETPDQERGYNGYFVFPAMEQ